MTSETSKAAAIKHEVAHQFEELAVVSGYLAFVFCALATYRLLLLNEFHLSYFDYGAALINALVVGKVILIGMDLHFGRRHEGKPLYVSILYKALLYGLLVFAFHLVEEVVKHLIHGHALAGAFSEVRLDDVLARTVVIFGTFIPLFGFLEVRRVIGEANFHRLLFEKGTTIQTLSAPGTK
jgi:hypothetical protein